MTCFLSTLGARQDDIPFPPSCLIPWTLRHIYVLWHLHHAKHLGGNGGGGNPLGIYMLVLHSNFEHRVRGTGHL